MTDESDESRSANPPDARYANYFEVGHNAFEFLLDFGQFYPGSEKPHLHTRIVTYPAYAKALLAVLRESVEQYERSFGEIQPHDERR